MVPRKSTESNSAEFASTSPLEEKAHIKLGQWGETAAAKYLTENGYEIILRNWKCPEGEIDIVAVDGSSLVIVEVKTRDHSLNSNFNPVEAIDARKVSKLKRLANRLIFLERMLIKRHHPQRIRFDVIAIIKRGQTPFSVEHIIDAFNY